MEHTDTAPQERDMVVLDLRRILVRLAWQEEASRFLRRRVT
jgi:hypothetical protein